MRAMNHAIVMGGSVAGLCAAAALAKNFDRVTVLERDPAPGPAPERRRGVPQAAHPHALLRKGQEIMDELFPGAFEGLAKDGAIRRDMGTSFRWFQFGKWKVQSRLGSDVWFQSRPLLEHHLRRSLAQNPKVELCFGAAIERPLHANGRVYAVRMRDGTEHAADLIVDATGRGSRSATWLEDWGYAAVHEQRVNIGMGYVSGVFEAPTGTSSSSDAVAVYHHAPVCKRGGLAFPIEGGRKIITLIGYHGDHAPTDIQGFRAWAKTLLRPDVSDLIDSLELVGQLHKHTFPQQIRRCYARMLRLPERYLIIGDAMCSFDPTFGQGMVVSAVQADLIASRCKPGTSTTRLQRALARLTSMPFTITANEAHRWAETSGWLPPLSALQRAYFSKVYEASNRDPEIYDALLKVMHFLAPPTSLVRPQLIWRVLVGRSQPPAVSRAQAAMPIIAELSSASLSRSQF
jgi:2-polyprenyl-6-methoxyphenol hydroxylase-like FAD-dependent oxidoreductase